MTGIEWQIHRRGRAWRPGAEISERVSDCPAKIDNVDGMLFWDEADRLMLLGMLLENVGADRAIRMGDPAIWSAAINEL